MLGNLLTFFGPAEEILMNAICYLKTTDFKLIQKIIDHTLRYVPTPTKIIDELLELKCISNHSAK